MEESKGCMRAGGRGKRGMEEGSTRCKGNVTESQEWTVASPKMGFALLSVSEKSTPVSSNGSEHELPIKNLNSSHNL